MVLPASHSRIHHPRNLDPYTCASKQALPHRILRPLQLHASQHDNMLDHSRSILLDWEEEGCKSLYFFCYNIWLMNENNVQEVESKVKKLFEEGLPPTVIADRIKQLYGISVRELTGKTLTTIVLGKKGISLKTVSGAVRAANALIELKEKGELEGWIPLEHMTSMTFKKGATWIDILALISVVWQYWHKKGKKMILIYNLIKNSTGRDIYVKIKDVEGQAEEPVLAYRLWLISSTKDKTLRKRRLKRWRMAFTFNIRNPRADAIPEKSCP